MFKQRYPIGIALILGGGAIAYLYYRSLPQTPTLKTSNYAIYSKSVLNRPSSYPIKQNEINPNYRPVAAWTGRLILPKLSASNPHKLVFLEIENAPAKYLNLVGEKVKLEWENTAEVQDYLKAVTKNVSFSQAARESQNLGNVHPERLNEKQAVDPLQSLAGGRSNDDVLVALEEPVTISQIGGKYTFKIRSEPVQITGRQYALVTVVQPKTNLGKDLFLVRHFNLSTRSFTGDREIVKIPQSLPGTDGISRFTNQNLEKSWYNSSGWYIYGAKNAQGTFVVQAIVPRKIGQLQPDLIRWGSKAAIAYLNNHMWEQTRIRKGTAQVILLNSQENAADKAISQWQEGDRAIAIHIYGGIGGKKAEPTTYGIVTGHFAYGIAQIVREPLSDRLTFDITYHQVYAHNPDGIVAGKIKAFSYLGDIARGWLGNRPIADIIIKFDPVTEDYNFGGIKLSPLHEFSHELQKMMARYRLGDGTGTATVSPVTSCVQDANQALYITINRIARKVNRDRQIQAWLKNHPHHPQTQRFNQLVKLGEDLDKNLVPLGIVRRDWEKNSEQLAGVKPPEGFFENISQGILSWRTILPRRAHDEISTIFLKNGARAWIIRTNQLGGLDLDIAPLAPTAVFGHNIQ